MPSQSNDLKPHDRINANFLESFSASWRAEGLAGSTLAEYVRHLRGFARYLDGSFFDATRQGLEAHVTAEMNRLSAATAAYTTRALRRFYGWLTSEEEIDTNPALRLKTPKVPESVTKIASAADVQKMISMCRTGMFATFIHRRDLALLHLLRSSGMRISEAARVELADIDVTSRAVIIPKTKTGKPRIAPIDVSINGGGAPDRGNEGADTMKSDPSEVHVNPRPLPDWSAYRMHLTRPQIDEVLHHAHIIPIAHGFTDRMFATKYPGWDLNTFIAIFKAADIHLRDIGHAGRCHWQLKYLHFNSVDAFAVEWDEGVTVDDGRHGIIPVPSPNSP